jgi:hypothetical protein
MDSTEQNNDFFVDDQSTPLQGMPNIEELHWTASEFIHHQKPTTWYIGAVMVSLLFAVGLFVASGDVIGPIAIIVMGILFAVGASRRPRTVDYSIGPDGVIVGKRRYRFNDFQSFTVLNEDQIESFALLPVGRFSQVVSIYFSPDDGQKIFDLLSEHVPFEQRERDRVDKFLHKIRF